MSPCWRKTLPAYDDEAARAVRAAAETCAGASAAIIVIAAIASDIERAIGHHHPQAGAAGATPAGTIAARCRTAATTQIAATTAAAATVCGDRAGVLAPQTQDAA